MVLDVRTGDYAQIGQDRPFAAASTIKIPILVAVLQAVDEGQVRLDERLRLEESHIAGGGPVVYRMKCQGWNSQSWRWPRR